MEPRHQHDHQQQAPQRQQQRILPRLAELSAVAIAPLPSLSPPAPPTAATGSALIANPWLPVPLQLSVQYSATNSDSNPSTANTAAARALRALSTSTPSSPSGRSTSRSPSPPQRPQVNASASAATSNTSNTPTTGTRPKTRRVRVKTDRRREQCRTNQARYRDKQRARMSDVQTHVAALRQQVDALELHVQQTRQIQQTQCPISPNAPTASSSSRTQQALAIACEYYSVFQSGLDSDAAQAAQFAFLHRVMAPDVAFAHLVGVDALVDQWHRYAASFHDLSLTLERADSIGAHVETASRDAGSSRPPAASECHTVRTYATLRAGVTETTLVRVFPHVARRESPSMAQLADRLVGAQLDLACVIEFGFDDCVDAKDEEREREREEEESTGDRMPTTRLRVQRFDVTIDFVAALLTVLQDLRDVAAVLEHARIEFGFCLSEPAPL